MANSVRFPHKIDFQWVCQNNNLRRFDSHILSNSRQFFNFRRKIAQNLSWESVWLFGQQFVFTSDFTLRLREIDLSRKPNEEKCHPSIQFIFSVFWKMLISFLGVWTLSIQHFAEQRSFLFFLRLDFRFIHLFYLTQLNVTRLRLCDSFKRRCWWLFIYFFSLFRLFACQRMCHTVWQMYGNLFARQFWFVCAFACAINFRVFNIVFQYS